MDVSIAELRNIVAQNSISIRELTKSQKETERAMKEQHAETERAMKESSAKMEQAIDSLTEKIKELSETVAEMSETVAETSKTVAELSDNLGNVGHKLGDLTELVVIPGIRREINRYGHDFKRSFANKKVWVFERNVKRKSAEVDLLLTNGTEAMAVEVKTTLTAEDVTKHIKQLEILRKYEKEANLRGKELYGALSGVYVESSARKLALKNGLYVLEIIEEEKKLKTDAPKRPVVW